VRVPPFVWCGRRCGALKAVILRCARVSGEAWAFSWVPLFALGPWSVSRLSVSRTVQITSWADLIPAVVPWFETVDALIIGAVTETCYCVLAWAKLVMLFRTVGVATDVAFHGVVAQRACLRSLVVSEHMTTQALDQQRSFDPFLDVDLFAKKSGPSLKESI
jgi:hypothetical protein